jgi:hypothetical protein
MRGLKRVDAHMSCFMIFALAAAPLGVLVLALSWSRRMRVFAVLPALAFAPAYGSFLKAGNQIEETPQLRENFIWSEEALIRLADDVLAGKNPPVPASAGRFTIVRYEILGDGNVALYTEFEAGGHEGRWGFVRAPNLLAGSGPATLLGLSGQVGEDNVFRRITWGWCVVYHHYWFVKRGWS